MTTETVDLLSPREAYDIASQWGSFMHAGDPGAAFYTFRRDDAQPQGENHRKQLLDYTESLLARDDLEAGDRADLEALKLFFERFPHSGEEFRETYKDESAAIIAEFDEFTQAYATAAAWIGAELPQGHPDADSDKLQDFDIVEFAPSALRHMAANCRQFQTHNTKLLAEAYERDGYGAGQAGHDFFLTRNGHGTGFWDRDALSEGDLGDKLSDAAKVFGDHDFYQGDDGGIYGM